MKKNIVVFVLGICLVVFVSGVCSAGLVWEPKDNMAYGRQGAFSGVVDGKLWVLGGDDGTTGWLNVVESYDPVTDNWQVEAPLPQRLGSGASATLDGKIYMFGGFTDGAMLVDWVWRYDPATGITDETSLEHLPTPRRMASAIVVGRYIYVIGGYDKPGSPYSTVEIYDVDSDSWMSGPNMETARGNFACEKVGDKIYAISGYGAGFLDSVEALSILPDGSPGAWETLPQTCTARLGMASVAIGPQIYIIAGELADSTLTSMVEVYDTVSGSLTFETSIPEQSHCLGAELINGTIHVFGGDRIAGYSPCSPKLDAAKVLIPAAIDIDPNTLNMKSQGEYITCYIELPAGFYLSDVDVATVQITKVDGLELVPPISVTGPSEIGTYDADGISYLMVKFDRQVVISELSNPGNLEFVVRGEFVDGVPFEGSDTIRVISRGR